MYKGTDKNRFDIENIYFQSLIPFKDNIINNPENFSLNELKTSNGEFAEVIFAVRDYLKTLKIKNNRTIEAFQYA